MLLHLVLGDDLRAVEGDTWCPHTGSCPGEGPSESLAGPVSQTRHTPSLSCCSRLGAALLDSDIS